MLGSDSNGSLPDFQSPRRLGGITQAIYVYVSDPDAHYRQAKAAGADIINEIRGTDYGARTYAARDLEGNIWTFGDYRPEVNA
jgi:uncharacterized glyoxalase superfamily protein PhnB